MKILVIGHARHGKDTVCEILQQEYNFRFESSSNFCARKFIFELLKPKYGYFTYEECFNDRHNHRAEWFDLIHGYCNPDLARLGREIFAENDIYCGLRNRLEFDALRNEKVFDYAVWVDRSQHLPLEPADSMNLSREMADIILDNNKDLDYLHAQVIKTMQYLV
jgi:dephospho-CoA kinase